MKTRYRQSGPAWLLPLLLAVAPAFAQVSLGTAQSFGVLGGSTVTNTGATIVNGDLGVNPGNAVTGFPPGVVVGGTIHAGDALSAQAQADTTTAYNTLAGSACNTDLSSQDLGGLTLVPGTYCFSSVAQLTGTLTLDAQGSANPQFIFQTGSTFTAASGAAVVFVNGGNSCNVFWQVGSSATLGTGSSVLGNILALSSITLNTNARVSGRVLARNGAATLDSNNVSLCGPGGGCPTINLSPVSLPAGTAGTVYNQTVSADGGIAPYLYTISAGALPAGLQLNPMTGVISGTPTASGAASFTVTATDANGCLGRRAYSILITPIGGCPTITLNPLQLPPAFQGLPYSQTLTATGGTAPYTFAVSAGALPAGLSLNPVSGLLSGTSSAIGQYGFTVSVVAANGCPGSRNYSLALIRQGAAAGIPALSPGSSILLLLLLLTVLFIGLRSDGRSMD